MVLLTISSPYRAIQRGLLIMSKSGVGSFKLEIIKNQILNLKEGVLKQLMESLPSSELKDFIILAEQVLSDREVQFKFSKESRDNWYDTFFNIYSESDEELVLERLKEIREINEVDFVDEYNYLSMWYNRETNVGGMYNCF